MVSIGAGLSKRTGMSLRGTIHTSSMIGGTFEVDGYKLVSAKIDAPWEQLEILEMGTEVSLIRTGQALARRQSADDYVTKEACTGDVISQAAGIKACSMVSYPKGVTGPMMMLTGNTLIKVTVEKTDSIGSYNFDYKYDVEQVC
jgi:hypothetical protein